MNEELYRVIDANLNRLKEGIRVIEDMAQFLDLPYWQTDIQQCCTGAGG